MVTLFSGKGAVEDDCFTFLDGHVEGFRYKQVSVIYKPEKEIWWNRLWTRPIGSLQWLPTGPNPDLLSRHAQRVAEKPSPPIQRVTTTQSTAAISITCFDRSRAATTILALNIRDYVHTHSPVCDFLFDVHFSKLVSARLQFYGRVQPLTLTCPTLVTATYTFLLSWRYWSSAWSLYRMVNGCFSL